MSSHPTSAAAEGYLQEVSSLDGIRAGWSGLWQQQADVVHPRRNMVSARTPTGTAPDLGRIVQNFDSTAMLSNRILSAGQFARITPMAARWFALRPSDAMARNQQAQAWYHYCTEILQRKLAASNFYNRVIEHYNDRGAFGTAITEITSGANGKGLHFRAFEIGTYSIATNSLDEVDTLARTYARTPAQIIQMFPQGVPESVQKKFDDASTRNQELELVHYIKPRLDRDPRRHDSKNKPWASVHILKAEKLILGESGFDEFPAACSRFESWGSSPYGWAPSCYALAEASQANFLELMLDTLAETAAFPRILYPYGMKGEIDFRAYGLTSFDPATQAKPEEWMTNGRYDIGKDRSEDKRRAIKEAYFTNLFTSVEEIPADATATQVREIVNQNKELFHPIFATLTREFLKPLLARCFALLLRQGEFPPPPDSVIQRDELGAFIADPEVEFTSAMALALEQSQLANFADVVNVMSPLVEVAPGLYDIVDTDAMVAGFFRTKGIPEDYLRAPDVIAQIRAQREQATQAAQAEQATGAIRNLGGAPGISQLQQLAS